VIARIFAAVALVALSACSGFASPYAVTSGTTIPNAVKKGPLLYAVSSQDVQVNIFTYPGGREIGDIPLGSLGEGICLGGNGAVWITRSEAANVIQASEYSHGATQPDVQLNADAGNALGCAQDPTTRDLAVASIGGPNVGSNLTIFPDAPKFPPVYYTPVFEGEYLFCAYDESGDLFVDGSGGPRGAFFLIELKKGSKKFLRIVPDRKIGSPGDLRWFKGDLLVADGSDTSIYRMHISGTTADTISTTTLAGAANLSYGFALYDGTVVAKPIKNTDGYSFAFWKFPGGGQPQKEFTTGAYSSFIVSK
jgi:hypothetical protein